MPLSDSEIVAIGVALKAAVMISPRRLSSRGPDGTRY